MFQNSYGILCEHQPGTEQFFVGLLQFFDRAKNMRGLGRSEKGFKTSENFPFIFVK